MEMMDSKVLNRILTCFSLGLHDMKFLSKKRGQKTTSVNVVYLWTGVYMRSKLSIS